MKKLHFFEPEDTPEHIGIGLRTLKTVLAVFIVGVICLFRDTWTAFAMIAVIICMQASAEKTIIISLNRLLATVIGGSFGVGIIFLADKTGLHGYTLLYYLVISLLIIPVILITLYIRKPSISALACVVLVSVAIARGAESPYIAAVNRILDTLIGIGTALLVNLALPNRKERDQELEAEASGGEEEKRD